MEIERIYVLKEFLDRKIGQALLDKAVETARLANATYILLGVWENNARAIAFYRKNGFAECGEHVFMLGDDRQTDILMRREINLA